MTNEDMMRPCTWGGKLFDAYQNLNIIEGGIDSSLTYYKTLSYSDVKIIDNDGYLIVSKKCASAEKEDVLKVKMEAITTIADALNAPVLATDAVLAGLPKDAKAVLIDDIGVPHSLDWVSRAVIGDGWAWGDDYDVMPYHRIQAFRCSKTAEYLRQFTLQGVRRVG